MITGSVIAGRPLARLSVWIPDPAMLNKIISGPAFVFALLIASRNVPAPESFVDVTKYVAALANMAVANTQPAVTAPAITRRILTKFIACQLFTSGKKV